MQVGKLQIKLCLFYRVYGKKGIDMSKQIFERSKRVLLECMKDDERYSLSKDAKLRSNFVYVKTTLRVCVEHDEAMTMSEVHELMEIAYRGAFDEKQSNKTFA